MVLNLVSGSLQLKLNPRDNSCAPPEALVSFEIVKS